MKPGEVAQLWIPPALVGFPSWECRKSVGLDDVRAGLFCGFSLSLSLVGLQ